MRPNASRMTRMVAIHGSGHTHESFDAQTRTFPECDAVSLPGHPEGAPLRSIGDAAVWLAKYLRWKGDGKAIVVGNSLGGAIALEWALRNPADVAGLVLIGSGARLRVAPAFFEAIESDWPACIDMLVDWQLSPDAPADLRGRVARWHRETGQVTTRQDLAMCDAFDVMDRLGGVEAPTLIIVGDGDRMTPPKYAQFLHTRIGGSQLAVIEGSAHLPHLERPDRVNALIAATFPALATAAAG